MTAFTLIPSSTQVAERREPVGRASEVRPAVPCRPLRRPDADQGFEAGVRWFLEVSRAA